jgi:hypothetical protein
VSSGCPSSPRVKFEPNLARRQAASGSGCRPGHGAYGDAKAGAADAQVAFGTHAPGVARCRYPTPDARARLGYRGRGPYSTATGPQAWGRVSPSGSRADATVACTPLLALWPPILVPALPGGRASACGARSNKVRCGRLERNGPHTAASRFTLTPNYTARFCQKPISAARRADPRRGPSAATRSSPRERQTTWQPDGTANSGAHSSAGASAAAGVSAAAGASDAGAPEAPPAQ